MNLKKFLLLPISFVFSAAGCAGIGPNATYYMGTTSFHYDPSYNAYMVKLNGHEIGGGFGGGMNTSPVKFGPQVITWEESNSDKLHRAKNQVTLTKEDLKGMKYLAVHLYPDDTVEVTTSNNWPNPTEKGIKWLNQLKK
ncbi:MULTISPECIES: hypothetical protein [Acinetobacter]|uniref:DUF3304 domain-containing protein n=2 Tax=Acinetobacter calcoaceticus/baumannii complex TaxID=909768 RepID=A0AB35JTN2_9GAMM|nr:MULTISPECIES: hypothetical protein [Acinetobacter]MDD9316370.1 hypothetical protein [Acinetobacter lactucae]MDD9318523.1 hypothetical protein [Acinetobacter lactucae]MDS7926001.1 hypothetical protein [Acinetobacter sp. V115_6]RZH26535.1 hypothetical protein EXD98_15240 [Acinetobacter pittii]